MCGRINELGFVLPATLMILLLATSSLIPLIQTVDQVYVTYYEQVIKLGSREFEGGDINVLFDYPTYSYILLALPHGKILSWKCEVIDGLYFKLDNNSTHRKLRGHTLWERGYERDQKNVLCEMVTKLEVRNVKLLLLRANKYLRNNDTSITVKSIKVRVVVEVENPSEVRLTDAPWIEELVVDKDYFRRWYKPVEVDYPIVIANYSYRGFTEKLFNKIYPTFYVKSRDEAMQIIKRFNPEIAVLIGVAPYRINMTLSEDVFETEWNYTYTLLPYMRHGNNISQTLIFYVPPMSNESFEKYLEKVYEYRLKTNHSESWLLVAGSVDGIHPMSELVAQAIKHKLETFTEVEFLAGKNVSTFPSKMEYHDNMLLIMHGNPWKIGNPEVESVKNLTEVVKSYDISFRIFEFNNLSRRQPTKVLIALSCLTARWWENDTLAEKFLIDGPPITYIGWSMPVPVRYDYRLRYGYGFTFAYLAADNDLIEGLEKAVFYSDLMTLIKDDPNWNDVISSLWILGVPPQ